MYTYEELLLMDKRTTNYKLALIDFKIDLEILKQKKAFLDNLSSLSKAEKKAIMNNADHCCVAYLHKQAFKVNSLRNIKDKLNMSWGEFNEFCLKVCSILDYKD